MRHEPPTIEEALAAARDIAPDHDQQVEIAAGLMGMEVEQVRAALPAQSWAKRHGAPVRSRGPRAGSTFIVERKSRIAFKR